MSDLIYGVRKENGKIVSINEIPETMSGLLCNCVCSHCGKELQACSLKEQYRRRYFRHNTDSKASENSQCNPNEANETALHKLAKQIIEEEQKILVPRKEVFLFDVGINNISKEIEKKIPLFFAQESRIVNAQSVELEKNLGNFVPDVFIKTDHGELLVEIFVSHRVDVKKKNRIEEYGSAVLEIDLSSFVEKPISSDELRDIILTSEKYKRWVYYPFSQKVLEQAKKHYEKEIMEYNKNIDENSKRAIQKTAYEKRYYPQKDYSSDSYESRIGEENYPFYLEIKHLFNDQNNEKIIDSRGKRWIECKRCGAPLPSRAFSKYNVDGKVNLGVCTGCCHKYKLF